MLFLVSLPLTNYVRLVMPEGMDIIDVTKVDSEIRGGVDRSLAVYW
jgi:hypothetical protein